MLNFILALLICWLCQKFWIKSLNFGLQKSGLFSGLQRFGLPAVIATLAVAITFCIGLAPFDNQPSFWRVFIEGIVYLCWRSSCRRSVFERIAAKSFRRLF